MADRDQSRTQSGKTEHAPGVIIHVTDQGATSPDPVPCDLDLEPPSVFGGGSSTRSNTASGPDPAQEEGHGRHERETGAAEGTARERGQK